MQFVVPQFIDVEAKIIGPVSARQFIIVLITAGVIFIWFQIFTTLFAGIATFFTGCIGGIIAFGKVNGQAMHYFLLNLIQTWRRPSLKVWKRMAYQLKEQATVVSSGQDMEVKQRATQSRLAQMSLMVDTGGAYGGDALDLPDHTVPQAQATEKGTAQTINLGK
jgi:hypothetical protein